MDLIINIAGNYFKGYEGFKNPWDYFENSPYIPYGNIIFTDNREEACILNRKKDYAEFFNIIYDLTGHRKYNSKFIKVINNNTNEIVPESEYLA